MKLRRIEIAYFKGSLVAERSFHEHSTILDAIAPGDAERSALGVRTNWQQAFKRMQTAITAAAPNVHADKC